MILPCRSLTRGLTALAAALDVVGSLNPGTVG
jgi:hypothetical protein